MNEARRFLLLSVLIGISTGLIVTIFHVAIELTSWAVLGTPAGARAWPTIAGPMLGAGLGALFVRYGIRTARGSGISFTKGAIDDSDGRVPAASILGKFVACTATIGSGAPLGPEDPALQMGAGAASLLGRAFTLTRDHTRLIVPVGAAAGIAAAFNTPMAAVLFVVEAILPGWNASVLGSMVLAAASASIVMRSFLGDDPLFRVPAFQLTDPSELLVYAGIGVVGGVLGALYTKAILAMRSRTRRLPRVPGVCLPFVAGLAVGLVALYLPGVLGAGYSVLDSALHEELSWSALLVLGLVRALLTVVCFGAGVPGGLFAPTLVAGALVGGGLGGLATMSWPVATSPQSAYVLVGMGTLFAAVFRTPMTAIFMAFELSATYAIILPVMVANIVAHLVARALEPRNLVDSIGLLEGTRFRSAAERRERRAWRVEDLMTPLDGPPDTAIPEVHPDEPLDVALGALRTNPVLLVVSRGAPARPLGTLSRDEVARWFGLQPSTPMSTSSATGGATDEHDAPSESR